MKFHYPVIFALFVGGCAMQSTASPEETQPSTAASPLVDEARASDRMKEQIAALQSAGWTVADWSEARVENVKAPATAEHPAREGTLVLLPTSLKDAQASIVFVTGTSAEEESVVLRPLDQKSSAALDATLGGGNPAANDVPEGPSEDGVGKVSSALSSGQKCWGCTYCWQLELSLACLFLGPNNPFGYLQRMVTRNGCGPSAGLYGNYKNNGIYCPYPNSSVLWARCGMP